jgi:hypothetical protein
VHERRLPKLANRRRGAEGQAKLLASIQARVPMVTTCEQRWLKINTAETNAQFWSRLQTMYQARADDHKERAALAERAVAHTQAVADEAAANAARAKAAAARLRRGEDVEVGRLLLLGSEDLDRRMLRNVISSVNVGHVGYGTFTAVLR